MTDFQVDRKVGGGTVVLAAVLTAVLIAGTVAIADQGDRSANASAKSQIKKLKKQIAKANRKAANAEKIAARALDTAEETSKQTGPQGQQGPAGPQGTPGAPGADGLAPNDSGFNAATVQTALAPPQNLGGPSATLTVGPNGGFVQFFASADVSTTDGASTCQGVITSPALTGNIVVFTASNTGAGFVTSSGGTPPVRFVAAGTHTFRLDYGETAGAGPCQFKNRLISIALFD